MDDRRPLDRLWQGKRPAWLELRGGALEVTFASPSGLVAHIRLEHPADPESRIALEEVRAILADEL